MGQSDRGETQMLSRLKLHLMASTISVSSTLFHGTGHASGRASIHGALRRGETTDGNEALLFHK